MRSTLVAGLFLVSSCAAVGTGAEDATENSEASSDSFVAKRLMGTDIPDLNGVWQAVGSAHYNIERHLAEPAMALREGPIRTIPAVEVLALGAVGAVPGGLGVIKDSSSIPYKPEALKVRDENKADWLNRDPEIKCYLPGVPRANYMPFPFQITHGEDSMMIAYEYAGAVRDIFFEDPGEAPVDSWMGQSFARWEGDTLVIEVSGQLESTWFDRAGNHHSNQLKVIERWTPISPNHLQYEAEIHDPETFTESWTISLPLYRRMEPDARIMDFKCVEFVEELLYGKWRRNPLPREVVIP
ncbi:MAG: hypothetical protein OXC80_11340 [Gammaproteobacteria bacterium]|nr:hypothetical protein [Gammaproteobacteria bacterium]